MKFIVSIIVIIGALLNPAFAMEPENGEPFFSKALPINIFEKDKKYEIPNYPTSVTPWQTSCSSGKDVRVGAAYVFSNCLTTEFYIHNSETIVGRAKFKYFPVHLTFKPMFSERMTNWDTRRQMTDREKLDCLHHIHLFPEDYCEPEYLTRTLTNLNMMTYDSSMQSYGMNLGLTMPVLYLDYTDISERYQRQGHGTQALKTIIEAFANSPEFPENVYILLQCKRHESYCVGAEDSEHKKYFKRFGFQSIEDVWPYDRHFMTVSLEDIKFPRPKKKVVVFLQKDMFF
jgi:hypothetical protein